MVEDFVWKKLCLLYDFQDDEEDEVPSRAKGDVFITFQQEAMP
jgi:hypothetical protein